ncbi:MAG: hypothetical protein K2X48_12615 [Chitinophagaceae bacterium]|nr:hypothetical protein [Chitinophagaceae bacterium]
MKQIILMCFLMYAVNTEAQLLKKIKEKAQQAVEPKKANEPQPAANNNDEGSSKTKVKWVPVPGCEKVFTLAAGETFFYDETKVTASNGKLSYAFIISNKKYEYFLIEDGTRSGPFKEPPVSQLRAMVQKPENETGDNNDDGRIELGGNKKDPVAMQYSKTISNKLYIVFNGKNYGPYDFVAKMVVSPDKKKFWAAVVSGGAVAYMGMGKTFLVNEAAVKQTAGDDASFPAKLMVSNTFSAAALTILDNSGQKSITVSSTGKKQEGNVNEVYTGNKSSTTVADNGDIISIPSQSPTQLMVNGTEAASFKVPVTSLSRLFILPDYKKSVFYQSGKLYRGDGSEESLTGVVFPKFVKLGNEYAVYYYKIAEQDNGDKDVYLCKKIL